MTENVTKEGIEVLPGQVWRDLDKRMNGRRCKVVSVEFGKAVMCSIYGSGAVTTRVSVRRMHKGSTGWELETKCREKKLQHGTWPRSRKRSNVEVTGAPTDGAKPKEIE